MQKLTEEQRNDLLKLINEQGEQKNGSITTAIVYVVVYACLIMSLYMFILYMRTR